MQHFALRLSIKISRSACACHQKWHSTFTKYCACHEKWFWVWATLLWATLLWATLLWATLLWATLFWATLLWATLLWATLLWATLLWATLLWAILFWATLLWATLLGSCTCSWLFYRSVSFSPESILAQEDIHWCCFHVNFFPTPLTKFSLWDFSLTLLCFQLLSTGSLRWISSNILPGPLLLHLGVRNASQDFLFLGGLFATSNISWWLSRWQHQPRRISSKRRKQ